MAFVRAVLLALLVASTQSVSAAKAAASRPNLLFVLADDLNFDYKSDRVAYMPNLRKRLRDGGAQFVNHVATCPVCGPSRSSFLLGRHVHNAGYYMNGDKPSIRNYLLQHNDTVGNWLREAGYHTAMFGKYVNNCEHTVPSAFSHWGGFMNTYDFYNASIWDADFPTAAAQPDVKQRVMTDVHQADFLGKMAIEQVKQAIDQDKPFFVHVTPVMPHWGTCYGPKPPADRPYAPTDPHFEMALTDPTTGKLHKFPTSPCPTNRHKNAFDGQTNPHLASYNKSASGLLPKHMELQTPLTQWESYREDIGFRNRSSSLLDLDDMLGDIFDGLEELGVLDNTYVFFSSDNGYHLGEHKLPFGKGNPYDTDIRLPMYVAGPGVPQNVTMPYPTTHLDITATLVELAGAQEQAPKNLDGLSFAGALKPEPDFTPDEWRQFSFSEFFADIGTWWNVRVHNSTHTFSYHWWCTNETEVFDNIKDPLQLENQAEWGTFEGTEFGRRVEAEFFPIATALGECSGDSCRNPVPKNKGPGPLPCYKLDPANSKDKELLEYEYGIRV